MTKLKMVENNSKYCKSRGFHTTNLLRPPLDAVVAVVFLWDNGTLCKLEALLEDFNPWAVFGGFFKEGKSVLDFFTSADFCINQGDVQKLEQALEGNEVKV